MKSLWQSLLLLPAALYSALCFSQQFVHTSKTQASSQSDWQSTYAEAKDKDGNVIVKNYKTTVNLMVEPAEPDEYLRERMWKIVRKDLLDKKINCTIRSDEISFTRTDALHSVGVVEGRCEE